jgi:putative ABC transport system substrate-binding protein
MRRRAFNLVVVGAAAWSLGVRAQGMPVIGYLGISSPNPSFLAGWRRGLSETGYFEGKNLAVEYHSLAGHYDLVDDLAAELVNRKVDIIVVSGGITVVLAAKRATGTIPIVFIVGGDPVAGRVVVSLARPGGNITGVAFQTVELEPKRLELMLELVPDARSLVFLDNPNNPARHAELKRIIDDMKRTALAKGVAFDVLNAGSEGAIDAAFVELSQRRTEGLLVGSDAYFFERRDQLLSLTSRHKIPAIYEWREYTALGGLASYGTSLADVGRLVGSYCGRILKGARPGELPVQQPTKFEFVINLRTAKTLGLAIPQMTLDRADEVIE